MKWFISRWGRKGIVCGMSYFRKTERLIQVLLRQVLFSTGLCEDNNRQKALELWNNYSITLQARPRILSATRQKLLQLGWNFLPYPSYSSDLASSDFHLFRFLQNSFNGKNFSRKKIECSFNEINKKRLFRSKMHKLKKQNGFRKIIIQT